MCEMFLKIVISIYVCVYVVIKFLINKREKKERKKKRENASSLHVSVSLTDLVFLFPHPASRVLSKS